MTSDDSLERISREDFEREHGSVGVHNPNVLDLIAEEEEGVVLYMFERRAWGPQEHLRQLEEKINRYLGYALDGFLVQQYPQYEGRPITIELECAEEPHGDAADLLSEAAVAVESEGLSFRVSIVEAEGDA